MPTFTTEYIGTGRRKTAVARVRLRPGTGRISINKRELEEFFYRIQDRAAVLTPLEQTDTREKFDVLIRVNGGGITGQAGACKLGIARALKKYDDSLDEALRDGNLLTRDSRMKERKKPGLKKARRASQFSKR